MRQLKYSEKKLLKHTDFMKWKVDDNLKEAQAMRKYYVQKREHYIIYNKMARSIREITKRIHHLDAKDPFRTEASGRLLEKLYAMGIIETKWNLQFCSRIQATAFCRRRLPCIMVRNKMVQDLKTAVKFVEQGHVRVGAEVVKDPALLVTRDLEDYVTWVNASSIRKHVKEYNEERDDFELANC